MPPHDTLANAIRVLAMDAVQRANSGHPGMPMGMADIATVLWREFLQLNPRNPNWMNRDRFVLSNGHGAMLQYALLHLTGFDLSIEDLRQFRQLRSKTPGHPEYGDTPGVETTTGPLGQGLANGVGMAIAEQHLAARYNRDDFNIVDHYTYVFAGDGCLMEGISHEACSLAGTLGLNKLIVFYDDNGISIDGDVEGWFRDDTPKRFEAYHWHVISVDGHDPAAVRNAIQAAQHQTERPTLICCKTQIGFGSPNKVNTAGVHGAPLGEEEVQNARKQLNWTHPPFEIPDEIYAAWDQRERGQETEAKWNQLFAQYETANPELAAEFLRTQHGVLPEQFTKASDQFIQQQQQQTKPVATRKSSQDCLNAYAPMLPELLGGSADLTGSNCTRYSDSVTLDHEHFAGNYLYYGVREFAMSAIMNGLALHGGVIPYGGTFLVFTDYARNAVRLSALMKQRVIYVYSHDSIGLGEDGPTHQPVEHTAMLRMTPGMHVWRPCDGIETAVAWQLALQTNGPSCLLLSRQSLPQQSRVKKQLALIARGGYVLIDSTETPDAIIIATGSEVQLAVEAAQALTQDGYQIRVVSMPCCETFREQDDAYRASVLPSDVTARVAVEAGIKDYWYQFVGSDGCVVGLDGFGASAPYQEVYQDRGLTSERVQQEVLALLQQRQMSNVSS